MPKICFISDSHSKHKKVIVPECDLLIHAGDWSFTGEHHETVNFAKWINKQPAKEIVVIPGNHERIFFKHLPDTLEWFKEVNFRGHLLIDQSINLYGLNIYGSPWTPAFGFDWAWNAGRTVVEASYMLQPFIGDIWAKIPDNTDILVTHGPPLGILDEVLNFGTGRIESVGCKELSKRIDQLPNLKYHVFGHIHLNGGKLYQRVDGPVFINASVCDERYQPVNTPVVIEI